MKKMTTVKLDVKKIKPSIVTFTRRYNVSFK